MFVLFNVFLLFTSYTIIAITFSAFTFTAVFSTTMMCVAATMTGSE
jgi:hypothetical protein